MKKYKVDLMANKVSEDYSIMGKVLDYHQAIKEHEKNGLNLLLKSPSVSSSGREVWIYERHKKQKQKALMFGSNNYLGVITNKEIIDKTVEVVENFGTGSGGVPVLSGTTFYHDELERVLSEMTGFDATMLFTSGFTANLGVLLGLVRTQNLVVQDRLNHASLIDGALMSGAKMTRYKHNDLNSLEKILSENYEHYKNGIIVVTDGVFSMDGDIANIPGILEIVNKYNAILLIDEAHSTGIIGENGAGILSHFGIEQRKNIILTGTLSKALGAVGGYISASKEIIDYLRVYARSNLYSTSLPPSVCATAIEAIRYMRNSNVIGKLNLNAKYMRDKLRENGYNILNSETAVIPIIVKDEYKLTIISKDLLDSGIYVSCIFPPAVPPKTARIRINMSTLITEEDIDYFIDVVNELFAKYQIEK